MALQRITFDFAGERQLSRAFNVLERDARDLREPLGRTADHLVDVVGEQFGSEGAHGLGGRWQDLSPDYQRQKADRYPGMPILVATGEMRRAFLVHGTRQLTSTRLVWGPAEGSEEEQRALAHQSGKGSVPQRKIVALTTADKRGIDRIFAEYFSAKTRSLVGR